MFGDTKVELTFSSLAIKVKAFSKNRTSETTITRLGFKTENKFFVNGGEKTNQTHPLSTLYPLDTPVK